MQPTKLFGLGGAQEIGKSTFVVESNNKIFIIDAGIKFADSFTTGIKGIIPDYSYLKNNQEKIQGLFITHGHEDHIGGIPYLVQQVTIHKIFAPKIAIQFLKLKFQEHKIKQKIEFIEIEKDAIHKFKEIHVDFWTAQHSIPDAFGIRFKTKDGNILFTGDFRFDYNPIGNFTDFSKIEKMGKEGVTVLLSDSTNAMRPMHSPSESDILNDIKKYIVESKGKTIITAFASNLTRVTAIIKLVAELDKKVIAFGRSMVNGIEIGRKLNYIDVEDSVFIDKKNMKNFEDKEIVILTTGSQGEQLAALSRMANKKHPQVNIKTGDMIIFSSSPIPGNRMQIELLINKLYKLGAEIKENRIDGYLHTSGHAYKEEHIKIFNLTKPKYFLPYHGEYRMAIAHGNTAIETGIKEENVMIPGIGDVYYIEKEKIWLSNEVVDTNSTFIDGQNILTISKEIFNDRNKLGESGFVDVVVAIDKKNNNVVFKPKIISRGCFYAKNSMELLNDARNLVRSSVTYLIKNKKNWTIPDVKQMIQNRLEPLFYKTKRRKPLIISSVLFIDEAKKILKKENPASKNKKLKNKTFKVLKKEKEEKEII